MDLEDFFVIRDADLARFRKLLPKTKRVAELNSILKTLLDAHRDLKRYTLPFGVCGKPVQLISYIWASPLRGESLSRWGHAECIDRQEKQG
jgi:hypothetical protein